MSSKIYSSDAKNAKVQIELTSNTLQHLLKSGVLHGVDCKCLNANAKQILWQTLLSTSTETEEYQENYLCA
jgi:hypothetical protein